MGGTARARVCVCVRVTERGEHTNPTKHHTVQSRAERALKREEEEEEAHLTTLPALRC